jgi:methylenetetrahydrofolate dehydrogenase (NADP+)/methenyltetrahydrofolate cyclohydrolase
MDGRALRDETVAAVRDQLEAAGSAPDCLVTVLVGDDRPSRAYVRCRHVQAEKAGLRSRNVDVPSDATQDDVEGAVAELAADPSVHGILVQLPLPGTLDADAVIDLIAPDNDVDGLTERSLGRLVRGKPGIVPCTPPGVLRLIARYAEPTSGRRAVVVERSLLVRLPTWSLLARKGVDATVTIAHSGTADLAELCCEADILIAVAGQPGIIAAGHVRPEAGVFDVGITRTADGLVGDVDQDAVQHVAGWLTPTPVGTGPMTVACLVSSTVEAARLQGALR